MNACVSLYFLFFLTGLLQSHGSGEEQNSMQTQGVELAQGVEVVQGGALIEYILSEGTYKQKLRTIDKNEVVDFAPFHNTTRLAAHGVPGVQQATGPLQQGQEKWEGTIKEQTETQSSSLLRKPQQERGVSKEQCDKYQSSSLLGRPQEQLSKSPKEQLEKYQSSSLSGKPDLEVALREQLDSLNQVLSRGNVRELLRFFTPSTRVDMPGRPGVNGHGAELVFALQTLFMQKGHRRIIVEEAIQLREVRVKGENDKKRAWFLLTRNGFPLIDTKGAAQAAKAVILWELVYGLAETQPDPNHGGASSRKVEDRLERTGAQPDLEPNDPKPRLMIRWFIWNDDGPDATLKVKTARGGAKEGSNSGLQKAGLRKPGLHKPGWQKPGLRKPGLGKSGLQKMGQAGCESNAVSVKSVYRALHARWNDFNRVLNRGDFTGCMAFTCADTVVLPPGNPPLLGKDLEQLCKAFVQEEVTQEVIINEALLLKGRPTARGPRRLSSSKVTHYVLESDAFTNSYAQSNDTDSGKQVILWEVHPKGSKIGKNGSPLKKGTLKWGWTIWNGDAPEVTYET